MVFIQQKVKDNSSPSLEQASDYKEQIQMFIDAIRKWRSLSSVADKIEPMLIALFESDEETIKNIYFQKRVIYNFRMWSDLLNGFIKITMYVPLYNDFSSRKQKKILEMYFGPNGDMSAYLEGTELKANKQQRMLARKNILTLMHF